MIRINLVPGDILVKEDQRLHSIQAVIVIGILLFVGVGASWLRWNQAIRVEESLAKRQERLEALKKIVEDVKRLEATAGAVRTRLVVITDLLKGRPLYPFFMTDFAKTLPSGVWISNLTTTTEDKATVAVQTAATASSSEAIADWLRNFAKSGRFAEPVLSGISMSALSGVKRHSFSISTKYKNPEL